MHFRVMINKIDERYVKYKVVMSGLPYRKGAKYRKGRSDLRKGMEMGADE